MLTEPPLDHVIADAERAVTHARSTRKAHARKSKRGNRQREVDLSLALERIREAMKPIRRRIARLPYQNEPGASERLREASDALQRERRKLWKMRKKKGTK